MLRVRYGEVAHWPIVLRRRSGPRAPLNVQLGLNALFFDRLSSSVCYQHAAELNRSASGDAGSGVLEWRAMLAG